jgi:uncharacterized membrane-anchored protein YitT (DUF2179 family)
MSIVREEWKNFLLIVGGIFSAALGLKGFLISARLIDGGVMGVSMLLADQLSVPLGLLVLAINLPFVGLGYKQIGFRFSVKTAFAITGLSIVLLFTTFPDVTTDKLLTAVFGGFFLGAGIGLAIRGGAVLDGTEIAALLISRKSNILRVGDVILILNIFIFLAAAFLINVEAALYSILTYAAATRMIDFLVHGVEEYTAINIVSTKSEEIKRAIIEQLNHGVTVYRGEGGMGSTGEGQVQNILYCVVTRLEIGPVKKVATDIDPQAFVTTHTLNDVEGGLIKKRVLH